jgi:hypothetical protein
VLRVSSNVALLGIRSAVTSASVEVEVAHVQLVALLGQIGVG